MRKIREFPANGALLVNFINVLVSEAQRDVADVGACHCITTQQRSGGRRKRLHAIRHRRCPFPFVPHLIIGCFSARSCLMRELGFAELLYTMTSNVL